MSSIKLVLGDSLVELDKLEANSVHSIVVDPPYEIGFMGKGWDNSGISFSPEIWEKAMRVIRPGGYMLAFSSTRTMHKIATAIEGAGAGWQIRDTICWH